MDQVRLPDLEVIRRFSIAVRREHAPAEEVVAALRADLEAILGKRGSHARQDGRTEPAAGRTPPPQAPKPTPRPATPTAAKPAAKPAGRSPAKPAAKQAKRPARGSSSRSARGARGSGRR